LNLATVAGVALTISAPDLFPTWMLSNNILRSAIGYAALPVGVVAYVASTIALLAIIVRHPGLRSNPRLLFFIVLGWAFFLPAMFSRNPLIFYWSYAIGHGGQYLIITGITARRSSYGWYGFAAFALITVGIGAGLRWMSGNVLLAQMVVGVLMVHFVIDAKLWRLREPLQRKTIRARMPWVFPATTSPS
jgi:hypothetical protein